MPLHKQLYSFSPSYSDFGIAWPLHQELTFLNHGSFGSTPLHILARQAEFRTMMESEPIGFFKRTLEPLWDDARQSIARFVGTQPQNVTLLNNTTSGVNLLLHSLHLMDGDEVLTTNHTYGACLEVLKKYAAIKGFSLNIINVSFPIQDEDDVLNTLEAAITSRTRLLFIDHVTSATATLFPLDRIIPLFRQRGIEVMIDGAHAIGMLPLDLDSLGANYYVGNCHKWLCTPKGSAILYVHPEQQYKIRPLQTSYQYDLSDEWSKLFYWSGTDDPTALLCIPEAIDYMGGLKGSWEKLQDDNLSLTLEARNIVEKAVNATSAVPGSMLGSMANIHLGKGSLPARSFNYIHPLQERLYKEFKIVVPVMIFPKEDPQLWIRISAQVYNDISQYEYLGEVLKEII